MSKKIKKKSNKTSLPNLFIIGAPKCGTTSLATELGKHSDIYIGQKEPRYFDAEIFYDFVEDYPIKSQDDYLNLFKNQEASRKKYRLDASIFSMYSKKILLEILAFNSNAKFIIILRDPLDASKSMHAQRLKYVEKQMREVSDDFYECWSLLNLRKKNKGFPKGCRNKFLFRYDLMYSYDLYLPDIVKIINKKNLLFVDYAFYNKNPKSTHDVILDFLKLKRIDLPKLNMNKSKVIKLTIQNKLVYLLRELLKFISLKLNLNHTSLSKKISCMLKFKTAVYNKNSLTKDDEIRIFFNKSYLIMNKIFDKT